MNAPPFKIWIILILLTTATGCASFYARMPNLEARIDAWVSAHQYEKAINTIRALDPAHEAYPELVARIDEIKKKQKQYVQDVAAKTRRLMERQEWGNAVASLDRALENVPEATALKSLRETCEKRRRESMRENKRAILLARGRYLLTIAPWKKNMVAARTDASLAAQEYQEYQQEVEETAQQLYDFGTQAYEAKDFNLALEILTVSNRLSPNPEAKKMISRIWRKRQDALTEARNQKAAAAEKQWPMLEAGFQQALEDRDLSGARRIVDEMTKINPKEAEHYNTLLQHHIEREVQELMDRGQVLYAKGYIREAMQIWQEALKLKPGDPVLKENIHRAKTFLENMDRWGE